MWDPICFANLARELVTIPSKQWRHPCLLIYKYYVHYVSKEKNTDVAFSSFDTYSPKIGKDYGFWRKLVVHQQINAEKVEKIRNWG